ncbi:MAG: hypothetical protein RKO66_05345 [Candidatus Contendobacter sp.]|nr:hypothetical protein [Candidatus Contendobacter sp.]
MNESDEDICGLCGLPGADKIPHTIRLPGETVPTSEFVHAECEQLEMERAFYALSEDQRREFLSSLQ